MHHFLNRQTGTPHRHAHTHTHTDTQWHWHRPIFVSDFCKCRKAECENEQARKERPRMRCVIHFHRGGWGQPGADERLPIVRTRAHTHTHARLRWRAASSTAQPNMLQHLPKKSENECKLRLFYAPRHLCLTLVITIAFGVGGGAMGAASDICQQKNKKKEVVSPAFPVFLQARFYGKPQGVSCQSCGKRWHHTRKSTINKHTVVCV